MAITGKAWVTTITGRRRWRVGGRKLMSSARPAPASGTEGETDQRLGKGGDGMLAPELGPRLEGGEDARRRGQHVGGRCENRDHGLPDHDEADRDEEGANRDHRGSDGSMGSIAWAKRSAPTRPLQKATPVGRVGTLRFAHPTNATLFVRGTATGSLQTIRMHGGVMAEITVPVPSPA